MTNLSIIIQHNIKTGGVPIKTKHSFFIILHLLILSIVILALLGGSCDCGDRFWGVEGVCIYVLPSDDPFAGECRVNKEDTFYVGYAYEVPSEDNRNPFLPSEGGEIMRIFTVDSPLVLILAEGAARADTFVHHIVYDSVCTAYYDIFVD